MGPDTKEKNMNKTLLALGLLSLYASATETWASTIKQRECYPSQDLRICLYQDSRVASDPNAGFYSEAEGPWEPPLVNAEIRIFGTNNEQLARLKVFRLAKIHPTKLIDQTKPVFLLDEDRSMGAGGFNGMESRPFTASPKGIHFLPLKGSEINKTWTLLSALRANWREVPSGFLVVSSFPDIPKQGEWDGESTKTTFSRLTLDKGIFTISSRSEPIYWESESDFPEEQLFPK